MRANFKMSEPKKSPPAEKSQLHPRSKHRSRYDFQGLIHSFPELGPFVKPNKFGDESIDFFDPKAVRSLNQAIMKHHYGVDVWKIPEKYLSPPIPGRADYLHYAADLLAHYHQGKIPRGNSIRCLDIGVGASCIYPIIGHMEFGWAFTGSDIDPAALKSSRQIVDQNPALKGNIDLRLQADPKHKLQGIIQKGERYELVFCNPPFHASPEEAQAAARRKLTNLKRKRIAKAILNFGGVSTELWCEGGEKQFILDLIAESAKFASSVFFFTSLVSKESNLKHIYKVLKEVRATEVVTMPMGQGNKISRAVAWTFLDPAKQKKWTAERWPASDKLKS
jgi:23S rRNA (adenine1618-N6)-methyltransferase